MPEIGEIRKGLEIGKRQKGLYIWLACPQCSYQRWVEKATSHRMKATGLCHRCSLKGRHLSIECREKMSKAHIGSRSYNWKGGRIGDGKGYILVRLYPSDFFYPMTNRMGYVLEHRLVMAKHLGRCLQPWEIVHHKNHNKANNRFRNLTLEMAAGHNQITMLERRVKELEHKVEEQGKLIRLLQWQRQEAKL